MKTAPPAGDTRQGMPGRGREHDPGGADRAAAERLGARTYPFRGREPWQEIPPKSAVNFLAFMLERV
jgi:hypothetical protein